MQFNTRFLIEQYHVISNNRLQQNELVWSFQTVFITAQAFLLILAVGGFVRNSLANAIGAFCGFVFGFMSFQAFERSRIMEIADAELLLNIEKNFKSNDYRGIKVHHKPLAYSYLDGSNVYDYLDREGLMSFLNRGSSYELWRCGMRLVMLVELSLFAYHMFVFAFKGSPDPILWYKSYDRMRESLNKIAIGTLITIFVANWIVYMLYLIQKSHPTISSKGGNINQKSNPCQMSAHLEAERSKETSEKKEIRLYVSLACIFQLLLSLIVVIHSLLVYLHYITFHPGIWRFLLRNCSIFIILQITFMFSQIKHSKAQHRK